MDYNGQVIGDVQRKDDEYEKELLDNVFRGITGFLLTRNQKRGILERTRSKLQSNRRRSGQVLETALSKVLDQAGITYREQVNICKDGFTHEKKKGKKVFRVDYLVCPPSFNIGDKVGKDCVIVSCKKSLRERANQESDIHHFPENFVVLTTTDEVRNNVDIEVYSTVNPNKNVNDLLDYLKSFQDNI